jgi:[ribosomal protein S5]-alanine N-acetyltransferase
MEQMPYHSHEATGAATGGQTSGGHKVFPPASTHAAPKAGSNAVPKAGRDTVPEAATTTSDWQASLPVLHGQHVTLRELRLSDAPSLLALLTTEEVARFISPPPTSLAGFERFITWTRAQRRAGKYACFAVIPEGMDTAIGIFQVRALEPGFGTAEWGFALGSPYWGRGIFADGAAQVLAFAFETIGVHRLEARSSVENGRGNGALKKVGAVCEGTLRESLMKNGRHHDQNLWTILDSDWRAHVGRTPSALTPRVH